MLNMCQISSLMAATDGPVAEFSSFATFEERKRKSILLMSFPKIVHQKGSFGRITKNPLFRFCRPILDIFGLTLLRKWWRHVKTIYSEGLFKTTHFFSFFNNYSFGWSWKKRKKTTILIPGFQVSDSWFLDCAPGFRFLTTRGTNMANLRLSFQLTIIFYQKPFIPL